MHAIQCSLPTLPRTAPASRARADRTAAFHAFSARRSVAVAPVQGPSLRIRRGRLPAGVRSALAEPPPAPVVPDVVDPTDYVVWPEEKVRGKPRVLVLGSGWAAVAFIKNLDPAHYAAALISPRNYFLCVCRPVLRSAALVTPQASCCLASHRRSRVDSCAIR